MFFFSFDNINLTINVKGYHVTLRSVIFYKQHETKKVMVSYETLLSPANEVAGR